MKEERQINSQNKNEEKGERGSTIKFGELKSRYLSHN
jgi:hypothetical protein